GDDLLLDPVLDRGMLTGRFLAPGSQLGVVDELDAPDDRRIDVDQSLQGGNEEGARAAGRIEDRELRQDLPEQLAAEPRVEAQQELLDRLERRSRDGEVDLRKEQWIDRLLAEVLGDLRARVVGPELLLVDVLLEDVAEHVRVD